MTYSDVKINFKELFESAQMCSSIDDRSSILAKYGSNTIVESLGNYFFFW